MSSPPKLLLIKAGSQEKVLSQSRRKSVQVKEVNEAYPSIVKIFKKINSKLTIKPKERLKGKRRNRLWFIIC